MLPAFPWFLQKTGTLRVRIAVCGKNPAVFWGVLGGVWVRTHNLGMSSEDSSRKRAGQSVAAYRTAFLFYRARMLRL